MYNSFDFRFSQLPKYLLVFKIIKPESTSKITAQFETILECMPFSLFIYIYLRNKHGIRLTYILIPHFNFHLYFNQTQFFTLDFCYMCYKLVRFCFSILCKFYTIWKFKKFFHCIFLILSGELVWIEDLFRIVSHLVQMNGMSLKQTEPT